MARSAMRTERRCWDRCSREFRCSAVTGLTRRLGDKIRAKLILSVSGPVVIGEHMRGCAMYELVRVGHDELVGGVFRFSYRLIALGVEMFS
jgi:hypothetical protein